MDVVRTHSCKAGVGPVGRPLILIGFDPSALSERPLSKASSIFVSPAFKGWPAVVVDIEWSCVQTGTCLQPPRLNTETKKQKARSKTDAVHESNGSVALPGSLTGRALGWPQPGGPPGSFSRRHFVLAPESARKNNGKEDNTTGRRTTGRKEIDAAADTSPGVPPFAHALPGSSTSHDGGGLTGSVDNREPHARSPASCDGNGAPVSLESAAGEGALAMRANKP